MRPISEEEFLKCYDECSEAIYRHCFFRVFAKGRAEELVQEAFMRTWEYIASGKKVDNLRAFVYKVANNLIIDDARKKKEETLEPLLERSPELEPAEDGQAAVERNSLVQEAMRMLSELPEEERRLITLRYVDELGPREIAKILDISPNNASVKLNRAVKNLRQRLGA